MIYDADVHYCEQNFFDDLRDKYPRFVDFYNETCRTLDLDKIWNQQYTKIKDAEWPECTTRDQFYKLNPDVKIKLKERFSDNKLVHLTDSSVYIDHINNHCPDLQTVLNSMYLRGVDRQVLLPYATFSCMFYQTDTQQAVDIMRLWNAKAYELCQKHDHLDPIGWLALQDLDASLEELKTMIDRKFFAIYLNEDCLFPFIPELWKIFEICQDNNMPIYFHPTRYNPYPIPWKYEINENYCKLREYSPSPFDYWKITAMGMITEGVLDRFPNLKIIMAEHGLGWTVDVYKFMTKNGWSNPLPYFKKNFWFTTEIEEPNFVFLSGFLGWDRLLFATDYPHNDFGGNNRFLDRDHLDLLLSEKKINQDQYDLITNRNYRFLKDKNLSS